MATSWREYQSIIYLILMAFGVALLVLTMNDLVIKNSSVIQSGFTLTVIGNWEYWIFALALIISATFAYYFVKVTNDTKSFNELIKSTSKHNFLKNLKKLQKIARNLGPKYEAQLQESMDKWKVK